MRTLSILALCLFLTGCTTMGSEMAQVREPLALNEVEQEFIDSEFTLIGGRNLLDADIVAKVSDSRHPIANPGEPFSSGCVVDPDLPRHRLLYAGQTSDMTFVHYVAGAGLIDQVGVLYLQKLQNEEIEFECEYYLPEGGDISQLKYIVRSEARRSKNYSCQFDKN